VIESLGHRLRGAVCSMSTLSRERELFGRLVLPHLPEAHVLARWIIGNAVDAEDVVQDACLRAFTSADQPALEMARNWLLKLVRDCAYGWLRKNRPSGLVVAADLEDAEHEEVANRIEDVETPETALIAKAGAERIGEAIVALPAPYREMLVLRDIQGLSYGEIAEITRVPLGTVRSRLARGRSRVIRVVTRTKSRGSASASNAR
jgi:RNA polymerase sigma factor (sigma-70 family)